MDQQRFDTLTRGIAAQGTRRSLMRGLTGIAMGGLAAVGLGRSSSFARALQAADSEEQSVILYEEIAQISHQHVGTCDALDDKLVAFANDHAKLLAAIRTEQDAWSHAKRVEHADTYDVRREVATTRLLAARSRCRFAVSSLPVGTPIAAPIGNGGTTRAFAQEATPVLEQGAQVDGPICPNTMVVFCLNPNTEYESPTFNVFANCSDPSDITTCKPCSNDAVCAQNYPTGCLSADGLTNECNLAYNGPSCCQQTCPVSTGQCLEYAGAVAASSGILGPNPCFECEFGWCFKNASCIDNCNNNDCCETDCPNG